MYDNDNSEMNNIIVSVSERGKISPSLSFPRKCLFSELWKQKKIFFSYITDGIHNFLIKNFFGTRTSVVFAGSMFFQYEFFFRKVPI